MKYLLHEGWRIFRASTVHVLFTTRLFYGLYSQPFLSFSIKQPLVRYLYIGIALWCFIKLSTVYKIRLREECTATELEAIMWKIDKS